MADYKEEDAEIKEAFEEFEEKKLEKEEPSPRNLIGGLPNHIVMPAIIIGLLMLYLTFIAKVVDINTMIWLVVAIIIIFMISGVRSEFDKREPIEESRLKSILYIKLKEKQKINPSEIPEGKIDILLPCKSKKIEGKLVKYVLSFKITTLNNLERYFTCEMDPFTSYILGFEERPGGFKGTEISDVKFIRRKEDIWEEKYFSGKSKSKK